MSGPFDGPFLLLELLAFESEAMPILQPLLKVWQPLVTSKISASLL